MTNIISKPMSCLLKTCYKFIVLPAFITCFLAVNVPGQRPDDRLRTDTTVINPALLNKSWPSSWIDCPGVPQRAYGVYHFRKKFTLARVGEKFIVHVTADNRYRLFVNGRPVCSGPARGDLYNWYFETVDLAPYLTAGSNTIAALVWNMGEYAPVAQVSNQTGFVLQGNGEEEKIVNTNGSWKVFHDTAYHPCSLDNSHRLHAYMVIGPGDAVAGEAYPWGWEQQEFDDSQWQQAGEVAHPVVAGYGTDNLWTLTPRNIPLMAEISQPITIVRRLRQAGSFFRQEVNTLDLPLKVPPHANMRILLDQGFNTVAYPELVVSGGKKSSVRLTYAEALLDSSGQKGNRNEITGKEIIGNYDLFMPDGGAKRTFRPLWCRTYRFLQLEVLTGDQALTIDSLSGKRTGYPFQLQASFSSNDSSLRQIWEVGWRTARLCAGETYFDCPYYEQLQYEGDTRIQALISLYTTGDDRLMRKALLDFYHSRVPEGLTQGRYPSNRLQVIPPFSLYWISMIYDYWMLRNDPKFVKQFMPAMEGVLHWYEAHTDTTRNMLGPMNWWNFVDWNDQFPSGIPPGAENGNSAVLTLQYAYTLLQAAALEEYFGHMGLAHKYRELASRVNAATYRECFDTARGVMGDTPGKTTFSQHAGIMAVLSGAIPADKRKKVMENILNDNTLSQATFFYRFYLVRALIEAGMADLYYSQLTPWRNMLTIGLTTFAEKPEPTRSDCHAWSSSPNYDFLATICGIMPDAPGFTRVLIRPAMGELREINGAMPHPAGMIRVALRRQKNGNGVEGEVELPQGLKGRFVWQGKEIALAGGKQKIEMAP